MTAVAYVMTDHRLRCAAAAIAWNERHITRDECKRLFDNERFVLQAHRPPSRDAELDRWLMERGASLHGRATKAPA